MGLGRADFDAIVTRLRTVGASDAGSLSQLRIHLHGAGPLRDGLDTAMTAAGYPVAPQRRPTRPPLAGADAAPRWSSSPTTPTTTLSSSMT